MSFERCQFLKMETVKQFPAVNYDPATIQGTIMNNGMIVGRNESFIFEQVYAVIALTFPQEKKLFWHPLCKLEANFFFLSSGFLDMFASYFIGCKRQAHF